MYNYAKRLTTVTSLLGFINAFVVLMSAFFFPNSGLDLATVIMISIYLVTSSAILILLTVALRNLCDALDLNFVKDAENTRELQERVHILEEIKK